MTNMLHTIIIQAQEAEPYYKFTLWNLWFYFTFAKPFKKENILYLK